MFDKALSVGVADSNVIASSILRIDSIPSHALRKMLLTHTLVFSQETLNEIYDVLGRAKFDRYLPLADRLTTLDALVREAQIVAVEETVSVCRDPKDDKFLSLAVTAGARMILTGDDDLLVLHPFRGVDILNPRDFLAA